MSIAPLRFEVRRPAHFFEEIDWDPAHPPENFSFSPCRVIVDDEYLDGWVYYPHPETKARHFQSPSTLEIITHWIDGLRAGDRLAIDVDSDEIVLASGDEERL